MCSLVTLLFLALPSAVLLKLIVLLSSGKTPSFSKCFATVLVADFLALLFWCMLWFLGLSGPWIATVVVVLTSMAVYTPTLGVSGGQGIATAAVHRLGEGLAIWGILWLVRLILPIPFIL
jgi:hypothetical protein